MSQLAHLRQKIRSIQTTKKVTHAIRLVSMSLYGKLEKQASHLHYYTKTVRSFFFEHLCQISAWKHPVLMPEHKERGRRLVVLVATSRGLCGSLNTNLFRHFSEHILPSLDFERCSFITVGAKAYKFVKEQLHQEVSFNYQELNSNNFITIADALLEKIIHAQNPYAAVSFVTTERKSFFCQMPKATQLIPLNTSLVGEQVNAGQCAPHGPGALIWEQPAEKILDSLAIGYVRSSIIEILFQALLSEYAARFLAMDGSTTNAEKYLERLTLQYNKARQAAITKEVSELTSGFMGNV